MRRTLTCVITAASLGIVAIDMAVAADMPYRPQYQEPLISEPAPVYNWTGVYAGGNLGGAWGSLNVNDVATGATVSPNTSGFAGGAQIGFDYQFGPWVAGIRNVIDGTNLDGNLSYTGPTFAGTINSKVNWFDALTVRGGYLFQPNLLIYGQAGAAWTQWDIKFNSNTAGGGEISGSKTGWTVGAGLEWMFVPHWSTFVEYNFNGFGTFSNAVTTCNGATCGTFSGRANLQNVLVGVNYRF